MRTVKPTPKTMYLYNPYFDDHKCIDTDGYWDGTWDESYEYIIYNEKNARKKLIKMGYIL